MANLSDPSRAAVGLGSMVDPAKFVEYDLMNYSWTPSTLPGFLDYCGDMGVEQVGPIQFPTLANK